MTTDTIETRACSIEDAEVRIVRKDDRVTIRGYAAVFDSWSPEYDGFSEIIRPGAFTDTLSSKKSDVRALFNHDPNRPLGRVRAGTMILRADNRGLLYEIDAPESASDVVEAIERRDITGSSFSFTVRKQGEAWEYDEKGRAKRELLSVNLLDVGPVTFPFYPQTSAAVRSLDRFRREHPELCPMDWRRLELAERGI